MSISVNNIITINITGLNVKIRDDGGTIKYSVNN